MKNEADFMSWLLKVVSEFSGIISEEWVIRKA